MDTFSQLNGAPAPEQTESHPLLDALASGKLPGLNVPKGYQPRDPELNNISLEHLRAAGLDLYRPHDPNVMFSVFNPTKVKLEDLQAADKNGELSTLLPSIDQFDGAEPPSGPVGKIPAPAAPQVPVLQHPQARPVQPHPVLPTERPVPAGGQLLNGLMSRAV